VTGKDWIKFVREYGPVPTKDNLFDENLRRRSQRLGIRPVVFQHPFEESVLGHFDQSDPDPVSVILTGTAGDGKTFLCGRVWEKLGGDPLAWNGKSTHFQLTLSTGPASSHSRLLHIIRDLSAWVPEQGAPWPDDKRALMIRFAKSLFNPVTSEIFLIAGNDGQLGETFRRLADDPDINRAWGAIEDLLVADVRERSGTRLKLVNLSRGSSVEMFDRTLTAFLAHEGWQLCYEQTIGPDELFGAHCPIRKNYELMKGSLIRKRLSDLLELCDQNSLHVPIRQVFILLANGILGHPDVKDCLMTAEDVPGILAAGARHKASLYNNLFGGNLSERRRSNSVIFDYLERFQIGMETSNRFDNILIFGESHPNLQKQFERFLRSDEFYGADAAFMSQKREYVEGADENTETAQMFLDLLVSQRRALFFKIPDAEAEELNLWELTVFRYGGEYLTHVLNTLRKGDSVRRNILARIVRGTNRIFTGMLLGSERDMLLASSANLSQARVCRFLDDKVSVALRRGERVEIVLENAQPVLRVDLGDGLGCTFPLTLTRYEYLSRVAEGALPNSFSKECFEDLMAFKSQLMRELAKRPNIGSDSGELMFRVLTVDQGGAAFEEPIGVSA
jgi:hypothetical protein